MSDQGKWDDVTWLADEIDRLTARNEHLEKRFGYLEGDWKRRNHIIESQDKRIAKLEADNRRLLDLLPRSWAKVRGEDFSEVET